MTPEFEDMANEVYREFAYYQHAHVLANPVCEICKQQPSIRITRWGTIKAACQDCLNAELQAFNEYCEAEEKVEAAYKEIYG